MWGVLQWKLSIAPDKLHDICVFFGSFAAAVCFGDGTYDHCGVDRSRRNYWVSVFPTSEVVQTQQGNYAGCPNVPNVECILWACILKALSILARQKTTNRIVGPNVIERLHLSQLGCIQFYHRYIVMVSPFAVPYRLKNCSIQS